MEKPYLITGRIRNNRLWSSIKEKFPKVEYQREAADALGVSSSIINALLNMRQFPKSRAGQWTVAADTVAKKLGKPVNWLFDDDLYNLVDRPAFNFAAGPQEWGTLAKMGGWPLKEFAHSLKAVVGGKK